MNIDASSGPNDTERGGHTVSINVLCISCVYRSRRSRGRHRSRHVAW